MFSHMCEKSEFRLVLLIVIDQPCTCPRIKSKKKGKLIPWPTHVYLCFSLLGCDCWCVSVELIHLLSLASADQIKNPSDKHGVTIGGTRCHHGPMRWQLKWVTGNFCIFCRPDRHSTALVWTCWSMTDAAFAFHMECILHEIQSPCSKNAQVSV